MEGFSQFQRKLKEIMRMNFIVFEPRNEEMCKEDPRYTVYLGKPGFFRLSFHNCMSCDFNCKVLPCYIYFFILWFKYMKFICSSFHDITFPRYIQ